jgi:hypothetical protein
MSFGLALSQVLFGRFDVALQDDCEQARVAAGLVLFARLPGGGFACSDGVERALCAADLAAPLDDDEELGRAAAG